MAIYSLNLGFISRSEGRSAVGFSAYISASHQQDLRTGVSYNYECKNDVIVSRVLAPEGAPEWAKSSSSLWNTVEQFEDHVAALRFRGNTGDLERDQKSFAAKEQFLNSTQTAQTIMGAIPIEFTQTQAEDCVEEFLKERFISRGLVVEYAIHWDTGNPHFHGLIARRPLVEGELSQRKDRDIVTKAELLVTRKQWEVIANKHLALGGHEVRIDSRSYADQGLSLLPTHHEGWYAQRLAERGHYSHIVTDNEAIREKNIEILCNKPEDLVHDVALKRTIFTRKHLEEEIIRRVGGDEKLFSILKAKVDGLEIPSELILRQANDNRSNDTFQGDIFEGQVQKLAGQFTDQLLANDEISHRVGENLNRDAVFTSAAYRQQEEKIKGYGDILQSRKSKTVDQSVVEKAIETRESELGFSLSEEQRSAIAHLCSGSDICVLNGKAGTGKTTLLKAVAEAYEESGYRVLGTSFQGKAVEIMEQEIGISCKTLDSFKVAWEKQQTYRDLLDAGKLWGRPYEYAVSKVKELEQHRFTEKDVIIVDEANMIGGHLWEPFLKEATEKGAKVLIVQDPAQIKSREPGDTGRLFAERYGFCETTEVVRQRVDWQRECSKILNEHRVIDGLTPYVEKGHMTWCENGDQATKHLTQAYVKDLIENPQQSRIALAYRNTEVYLLNQSIREALKEQGHLGESFSVKGEEYAIGDRIRFTQNDHHGRYVKNVDSSSQILGVKNGTFGTIESYDETRSQLTVCLDGDRRVQFNTNDYNHLTHGYALGIHKSEGSTFDRLFVVLDPLMDPSTLLVTMTRHRQDVQVYINRDQFIDFKAVIDQLSRPSLSQTIQDYQVSEDQKPYFERVQQYRDLTREITTLREEMEGELDPEAPLYKHPMYAVYQNCFDEKKHIAGEILKDWHPHGPYVRLAGIRKDILEVEVGQRPRLLSDLEHRASVQVQGYMDVVRETKSLWKTISETHPGTLAQSHSLYEDYQAKKSERDSIASVIADAPQLYRPFFRVTKDEASGHDKDYWGEVVERETRVYFTSVKFYAAAHQKSQMQTLFYERLSPEKKACFDEVKEYATARNEAAALYSHLRKQEDSVSITPIITFEDFHASQAKRDILALKLVESPEKHHEFFGMLNIKEDKLLGHAVAGELRTKVQRYAQEQDISKRATHAQELKRILTTSSDYRIFNETTKDVEGVDINRLSFDIAFYDKVKNGELSSALHPDHIYKPIQSYLNASRESAKLWKTVQLKGNENPAGRAPVQKDWAAAQQARNDNARTLMGHETAFAVLGGMRSGLQQRAAQHAGKEKNQPIQERPFVPVDAVLQEARGRMPEIAMDLLGTPNKHLSSKTALRFGNKGSLLLNVSGAQTGLWKDFESGEGGNILQLIQREKNLSFRESVSYLAGTLHIDHLKAQANPKEKAPQQKIEQKPHVLSPEELKDMAARLNAVSELHMKSKPLEGTLAAHYLRETRGITSCFASDLRFLPKDSTFMYGGEWKTLAHSCLAAFGRGADGRLSSVQLTKLEGPGKRALMVDGQKMAKIHYGVAKGSFVCVQEDKASDRVFIAEGLETALSLKSAGIDGKIVASMGIHNMANYQGPEKEIVLCGDNDDHKENSQTHKTLEKAQDHFQNQGKVASIIKPITPGDDFNDVLKKEGILGVQQYLKPYLNPNKGKEALPQSPSPSLVTNKSLSQDTEAGARGSDKDKSMDLISEYIEKKLYEIKHFDGTSIGREAKKELRDYLKTLEKNGDLFRAYKDQNKDTAKELEQLFRVQEQQRIKNRGYGMEM